jgi:hypothetical protein
MSQWLQDLPIGWMALIIFVATYAVTGVIFAIVTALASGERTRIFKGVSPGLLPPLGIIFALLVAFIAAQVWSDMDRATAAVNREASALRAIVILAGSFPGEPEANIRELAHRHVEEAVSQEWPKMARQSASLRMEPLSLEQALALAVSLSPATQGQITAQREMVAAIESAMEARRQRIIVSGSSVNQMKWICLYLEAICALAAIAVVHCDNRGAAALAMGVFATAVAVSVLLIASHDRPFSGHISVKPDLLVQAVPVSKDRR